MATTITNSIPACQLLPSASVHRPQRFNGATGSPVLTHDICNGRISFGLADLPSESEGPQTNRTQGRGALDTIPQVLDEALKSKKQGLENNEYIHKDIVRGGGQGDGSKMAEPSRPFHKWIRTLHKRSIRRQGLPEWDASQGLWFPDADGLSSSTGRSYHRRHSSSGSSYGFVTAVKSASMSLTTGSVLSRSRMNTIRSSRHSRADRSSRASINGARLSEDSCFSDRPASMDPAVIERSLQRRRILEELVSTEESYIGDVRFLMNVGSASFSDIVV